MKHLKPNETIYFKPKEIINFIWSSYFFRTLVFIFFLHSKRLPTKKWEVDKKRFVCTRPLGMKMQLELPHRSRRGTIPYRNIVVLAKQVHTTSHSIVGAVAKMTARYHTFSIKSVHGKQNSQDVIFANLDHARSAVPDTICDDHVFAIGSIHHSTDKMDFGTIKRVIS